MSRDLDHETVGDETFGPADQDSPKTTRGSTVSDGTPSSPQGAVEPSGRYELREEIARGGMGAVYVAIDRTLGRQVAVKLLQSRFEPGLAVARRFVDEAHIAGQLQHPGIPPIHDLGSLPDGRPFLAMKLIKGRTLDDLLDERIDASADRGRFIAVFEQVCQAVAYAHARRVIHRDLKPQNIMVGAFGEVQVMDWGLAKVLCGTTARVSTVADQRVATEILSARDTDGSETQSGSVLGTPAYMAPEQAVGAIDQVDERSDVFGLGGVLAVILTGRPPFMSDSAESTRVLAARGKVEECFARLDTCGAEPDLVELCKRCLSPEREDRPASAGEVASAVAKLRAEAEERARQAELDRVRAEGDRARADVEARAQRQKRRTQLAVAAGIFGLTIVGGGAWLAVRSQAEGRRADADRVASIALGRADQLTAQAGAIDVSEPATADSVARLWEQAEAAIAQSEGAIAPVGDAILAARLREKGASVRSGLARARRDAALLAALEAADGADTGTIGSYSDRRASIRAYRSAFEAAGLQAGGDAATLAAAVDAERPGLRAALLRALERWAVFLQYPPDPDANRVRATIDLVDADPIRKEIRATVARGDSQALAQLADRLGSDDLPPASAVLLGTALDEKGVVQKAVGILRSARDRAPSDLWILACLAQCLRIGYPNDPVAIEESVGCARTLAAVNPTNAFSHYVLGQALHFGKNDPASAEPHYRKTLELNPGFTHCMINLGSIRSARGDLAGAEQLYRKAVETDPQFALAHSKLANIWQKRGDLAGAEAEYRKLVALEPKSSFYHNHLGWTLQCQGDLAGAEAEYRAAIAFDPSNRFPRENLNVVERIAPLLRRLDDVLAGRTVPTAPAETANFALLCAQPFRHQYAAAARLYERAFADDPKMPADLANNPPLSHHYYAACSAALAGRGHGTNAPADPAGRSALRGQALVWFRAGLAERVKQAASDSAAERRRAADALNDWLSDSEEYGVGPGGLPNDVLAADRPGWDSLWSDVRAALAAAQKPVPPAPTTTKP